MNIKDFLIDNYIWILVVILLSIVTVIGFLADRKKSGKKEKTPKNNNMNNQNMPTNDMNMQPINYQSQPQMTYQPNNNLNNPMNIQQPIQNQGIPMNFAEPMNTTITPINQNITVPTEQTIKTPSPMSEVTVPNPAPNMNQNFQEPTFSNNMQPINQKGPVEVTNTMNNVIQEPIYQPLSEQRPVIAPNEIQSQNQMNYQDINGTIPTPLESNNIPIEPMQNQTMESMIQPNFTNPNINFQNNNIAGQMNPVNYQMPPQNTMSQPIPQPMPQQEANNTIPNPATPPQPVNPQPINFVYGPQQNNNNQMMQ